jgi:serine/threonine protein phosphatase PrpC
LAVTRAIGDRRLKKYVSAVPEIRVRSIKDADEYLILASDGVWDVLSSQAAVDVVCAAKDVTEASRRLTETAYKRGSMDNITSLVIDLRPYKLANAPPSPAFTSSSLTSSSNHSTPSRLSQSSLSSSPSKSD